MVEYSFKQLEELELAYAITIHKSQGSEYPAVVVPIYSGPRMLMTRNLIYTAVTRAKKCVCLVGLPEMFQFSVIFTANFSSPSICEVVEAVYAAIRAGRSASYSIYPATITSIAKIQPPAGFGISRRILLPYR